LLELFTVAMKKKEVLHRCGWNIYRNTSHYTSCKEKIGGAVSEAKTELRDMKIFPKMRDNKNKIQ